MKRKLSENRGYTLLFAVLISVLVLGVASFVANMARKQYVISSTMRDSLEAFYAADSAIECVLTTDDWSAASTSGSFQYCGNSVPVNAYVNTGNLPRFSSYISGTDPILFEGTTKSVFRLIGFPWIVQADPASSIPRSCVTFDIWVGVDSDGSQRAVVSASGHNSCDASAKPKVGPHSVERTIQLTM